MEWQLEKKIVKSLEEKGLKTSRVSRGASPYSSFDILVFAPGLVPGVDKASFVVSPIKLVTEDPVTAYKGRHGCGRLILVQECETGLVEVTSNGEDQVVLTLANGSLMGYPAAVETEELWPGVTLADIFP